MKSLKITSWSKLFTAIGLLAISSCDSLHHDEIANKISSNDKIYVLANAPTTFDLQSRVKANQPINISISSQPLSGSLSTIENGLFQYNPTANTPSDQFEISITDSKGVSKKQVIQLARVSAGDAPCGAIANWDSFYGVSGSSFDLDVLQNDIVNLCGGQVELSIYQPVPTYPPYAGTTEISNGKIHYTPNSNFVGYDKFFYELTYISSSGERGAPTYGRVFVTTDPPCTLDLKDDSFQFNFSSIGNVVRIEAELNDVICKPNNDYQFNIIQQTDKGKLYSGTDKVFVYELPSNISGSFTDSFVYQICIDGTCDQATVTLSFGGNIPSCNVIAHDDNYSIVGSSQTEFRFPVFENDNLCGESIASAKVVNALIALPPVYIPIDQFIHFDNDMLYYKPYNEGTIPSNIESVTYEILTNTGKITRATVKITR